MVISSLDIHIKETLLTPSIRTLIKDKAKLFKTNSMADAPFVEIVGTLTGYEMINTNVHCGGYCDSNNRIIALNSGDWKPCEVRQTSQRLPITLGLWQRTAILHEISHAIQAEAEIFEKDPRLLSFNINIEHQAESIAYQLYNKCYGPLSHRYFSSYFCKDSLLFLKHWHGGYVQDDVNL